MNLSIYIFGNLGSGYTQYPNDYTRNIFQYFYQNSQATTQLTIHRNQDLMYYGYVRKLDNNNYIGLCAVINGMIFTHVESLFGVFEGAIEIMVRNGYLIHYNNKGEITSKIGRMYENREEIYQISSSLNSSFNGIERLSRDLPPINYSTSRDSVKNFSIQDGNDDIVKSTYSNGYTFVYKSKGYNTAQMNSYTSIINKKKRNHRYSTI